MAGVLRRSSLRYVLDLHSDVCKSRVYLCVCNVMCSELLLQPFSEFLEIGSANFDCFSDVSKGRVQRGNP
jgi:hypothetical protein